MIAKVQWLGPEHLFGYLSAHDDDDAPDGAWWAMLEDGVALYNEQYHTNHDPHETVAAYLRKCDEEDHDS